MHQKIKQTLLKFGGYHLASEIFRYFEEKSLSRRLDSFLLHGNLPLPDHAMFEPTLRCNLSCRMCFQDRQKVAGGSELPLEQIVAFFEQNRCFKKITLIGGEPFVRRDILELIKHLDKLAHLVLCTNGTLLADAEWETLRHCRRILGVCVSLEGPSEIHDAIRGTKGCFEKTRRTIEALAPFVPVTVNCVLQKETLGKLDELVDICAASGVRKLKLELERLYGAANQRETMKLLALAPAALPHFSGGRQRDYPLSLLEGTVLRAIKRGHAKGLYVFPDPPYLLAHLEHCYTDSVRAVCRQCSCHSLRTATIAPDGTLLSCFNIRAPLGSIKTEPFSRLWHSADATALRRRLIAGNFTPQCENCPFLVVGDRVHRYAGRLPRSRPDTRPA